MSDDHNTLLTKALTLAGKPGSILAPSSQEVDNDANL
jgi:hypothetical protein